MNIPESVFDDQLLDVEYDNSTLHQKLSEYGRVKMQPRKTGSSDELYSGLDYLHKLSRLEVAFVEAERKKIRHISETVPSDPQGFVKWYENLKENGAGQHDELFPWLVENADYQQLRWFIKQEVAGEAGFEDLLALTQLHMPTNVKLEMARNYWDEMGRGTEIGMHGPMLGDCAKELSTDGEPKLEMIWQAVALGNLMIALASNRQYAYQAVGALGVIELTSPTRTKFVAGALKRLNVSKSGFKYFALHSTVDVRHSKEWNAEVITNLVADDPSVATYIAEGALMRLNAGARCFAEYRRKFGLDPKLDEVTQV